MPSSRESSPRRSSTRSGRGAGQDEINPKNPHAPLAKAVVYAVITGLAVGAAENLATRRAAAFYEKSSGHLPSEVATTRV